MLIKTCVISLYCWTNPSLLIISISLLSLLSLSHSSSVFCSSSIYSSILSFSWTPSSIKSSTSWISYSSSTDAYEEFVAQLTLNILFYFYYLLFYYLISFLIYFIISFNYLIIMYNILLFEISLIIYFKLLFKEIHY